MKECIAVLGSNPPFTMFSETYLLVSLLTCMDMTLTTFLLIFLACNNSCEAGYTLNTTTCTCSLSNICELSPCQNGGSCTLVSAPSNYTCDCTGTGYQGINCTNGKKDYIYITFYNFILLVNYTVPIISALVSYVAVLNGSSVTLRCVLHHAGNPNAAIQWTYAGSVITNDSLFLITEGSTRLDITNITTSYSGAYHCNASNIAGASVATINVDVQGLCRHLRKC